MVSAWTPINLSTVSYADISASADVHASSPICATATSPSSPTNPNPGNIIIRFDIFTRISGFRASLFSRSDFSVSVFTNSRHTSLLLSNNICHTDFGDGKSISSSKTTSAPASLPSRRLTTRLTASTSSITKITSLNPMWIGTSCPAMLNFRSKKIDISSVLVDIFPSGTFTIERPVYCANALMRLVFPVPGGPCRSNPILYG
mmetsp:Transcript_8945/g.11180  ORF Transcript_8945/g.11180 Transcript_8945/m.11180 type:complete len:203 (+) Transcript_8945:1143-1751(+)